MIPCNPFWPKHAFVFKSVGDAFPTDPLAKAVGLGKNLLPNSGTPGLGGGSSGTPVDALPVPTPAAPISSTNDSVIQAQNDYARSNLLKKSINKTIFAGDTGGWSGAPGALGGSPASTGPLRKAL